MSSPHVTAPTQILDHAFDAGWSGMGEQCNALVMREGAADDCNLPRGQHSQVPSQALSLAAAPDVQGLDLFEVYEEDGSLLLVTSDISQHTPAPGDRIYRRLWATAAPASPTRRA
ncbi:hypothetical protein [Nocardioides sp. Leaf285]|uniref:hypothetical protein n=1 Tax=Nocardioides sp. Leaf285 TaxID=1736322 RepID=UPI000703010D|nr:hypothetical protein [Nocardioides sp. Leaf285]KQP63040.1 hypothetical protein ASF47_18690 [Nocardioides sp. Leaf285]